MGHQNRIMQICVVVGSSSSSSSSSSESVLNSFKNLPLPSSSTALIKRPKNEHNLENTNNNNSSQALETDTDLEIMSYDEKIQRIKQEHVNELYKLQNQYKCLSCECRN